MSSAQTPEERLAMLNIDLPPAPAPGGNYLPWRQAGSLLFLAGVVSSDESGVLSGTVGAERSIEDGVYAARRCALIQIASIRQATGSLDRVESILTVNGYVNAIPGFPDSPKIINGASDIFIEIFGDAGRHARAAIGVAALPRNATVELQMILSVR